MEWKVIEQVGGFICALAGPDAHARPTADERLIWTGEANDNAEALCLAYHATEGQFDITSLRARSQGWPHHTRPQAR